jgi:pimeloyl-ACP methyl ester carboxylesterase
MTRIETFTLKLPHGIALSCRACGPADAPRIVLLHGFPEAAFIWDEVMLALADRYRCIAPNLRGFEDSSHPTEVEAYRAKHLMADIAALIAQTGEGPLAALVAHDWGGAVAWNLAVQKPELMQRLVIVNSPHPGTFLDALKHDRAQQEASAYMNFLCRPDAEVLLAENDFARLWPFFAGPDGQAPAWLDEATRERYRALWRRGLTGPLNYYRASPMRPATASDPGASALEFAPEFVTVKLPTLVVWGEQDKALLPVLVDGLARYVPQLKLQRVPDAGHWVIHQKPALIAQLIRAELES